MNTFPSAIDNSNTLPQAADLTTLFNTLREVVISIETELGIKPSGNFNDLSSRLNNTDSVISNLNTQITNINETLSVINSKLNNTADSITSIISDVSNLNTQVNTLHDSINGINTQLNGLNSSINTTNSNLTDLSAKLDAAINTINSNVNNLNTKIDTSVNSINSSIDSLNSKTDALSASAIHLSKDLGGDNSNPLVVGIQGHGISNAVPTLNQILTWDGSSWTPKSTFQPVNNLVNFNVNNLNSFDCNSLVPSVHEHDSIVLISQNNISENKIYVVGPVNNIGLAPLIPREDILTPGQIIPILMGQFAGSSLMFTGDGNITFPQSSDIAFGAYGGKSELIASISGPSIQDEIKRSIYVPSIIDGYQHVIFTYSPSAEKVPNNAIIKLVSSIQIIWSDNVIEDSTRTALFRNSTAPVLGGQSGQRDIIGLTTYVSQSFAVDSNNNIILNFVNLRPLSCYVQGVVFGQLSGA